VTCFFKFFLEDSSSNSDPMAGMSAAAGACCISGAALGAAISSLLVQMAQQQRQQRQQQQQQKQRHMRRRPCDTDADGEEDPAEGLAEAMEAFSQQDVIRAQQVATAKHLELDVEHGIGFTMQEAKQHAEARASEAKEKTPQEVLQGLQKGNTRFWMGVPSKNVGSAFQRRALISMQYPSVAILGCSDSRVPTEIVFDQGLGDLFVVRVAGNCLDISTLASLQYAVNHLKVKVLVVMGHEACGAVKAAGLPTAKIEQEPAALSAALKGLKRGLDDRRLEQISDSRSRDREAVVTNVRTQIQGLAENKAVMAAVRRKELIVVGAFYEISSGIVDFFLEITEVPEETGEIASPEPEPVKIKRSVSRSFYEVSSSKIDEVVGAKVGSNATFLGC